MKIYLIVEDYKGNKRVVSHGGVSVFKEEKVALLASHTLQSLYCYLDVFYFIKEVEL